MNDSIISDFLKEIQVSYPNTYLLYGSENSYFLCRDGKKIFHLKKGKKDLLDLYSYLETHKVECVLYPENRFSYGKSYYYVFPYQEQLEDHLSSKTKRLYFALSTLHQKTKIQKKVTAVEKKKIYRMNERLDYIYKMMEMTIRQTELKPIKLDDDWIILSKYSILLDCKEKLYSMERILLASIEEKESCTYCLLQADPHIEHLRGGVFTSLSHAKFGIITSDLAKFYLENDTVNLDFTTLLSDFFQEYSARFYKAHFIFLVLYIYIINLDCMELTYHEGIEDYIRITDKIRYFLRNIVPFLEQRIQ